MKTTMQQTNKKKIEKKYKFITVLFWLKCIKKLFYISNLIVRQMACVFALFQKYYI